MKRSLFITFLILLIASLVWAGSWVVPSTEKTADANAIITGEGYFHGIAVATDGTNSVTFVVYDALTATGTKLMPDWVVTTSASNRYQTISFNPPIHFNTGLTVDITTTGTVSYMTYTSDQW